MSAPILCSSSFSSISSAPSFPEEPFEEEPPWSPLNMVTESAPSTAAPQGSKVEPSLARGTQSRTIEMQLRQNQKDLKNSSALESSALEAMPGFNTEEKLEETAWGYALKDRMPHPCPSLSEEQRKIIDARDLRVETNSHKVKAKLAKAERANQSQQLAEKAEKRRAYSPRPSEECLAPPPSRMHATGACSASAQGKRKTMEDEEIATEFSVRIGSATKKIRLHGVFDGNGGQQCASYAKNNIVSYLTDSLQDFNPKKLTDTGIYNALKIAMVELSREYTDARGGACTANLSLQIGNTVWVPNVGDSRAILITPEDTIQLSHDAKPNGPEYKHSIDKRRDDVTEVIHNRVERRVSDLIDSLGVRRVSTHSLGVGRVIGGHKYAGAVTSRPKLTKYPLPPNCKDYYLLHVCDGITDVMTTDEIGEFVRSELKKGTPIERIPPKLVKHAYDYYSGDNLSAMMVPIKRSHSKLFWFL